MVCVCVCVRVRMTVCAGKMLYTNGLFTMCHSSGRTAACSPYQVRSAQLWFDFYVSVFVSMCPIFVSWLPDLPQTAADRHNLHARWIHLHTHTHTHTHTRTHSYTRIYTQRLEDKWMSLMHRQRCGQATFPFECSAKPQATITLVPVCLTAAEIERGALTVLWATGWWCATAGVWHCGLVFARYS